MQPDDNIGNHSYNRSSNSFEEQSVKGNNDQQGECLDDRTPESSPIISKVKVLEGKKEVGEKKIGEEESKGARAKGTFRMAKTIFKRSDSGSR